MSTLLRLPISPDNLAAYRFGEAELQLAAERLLIGGREVPLPPMAYRFLLCLCQARGGLLARAHVFDVLWPGGGSGSDEALAQIVLKVRQALGEEGRALVTVRGRGFRLDLPVEPVPLARLEAVRTLPPPSTSSPSELVDAANHNADAPTPVADDKPARQGRPRAWHIGLVAALVAVLAVLAFIAPWRDHNPVMPGYGFRVTDFGPISPQGIESLRLVQLRDDEGDRTSAEQLLRALVASEPQSALPPFLLSLWISGSGAEPKQWQNILRERLPPQSSAYVQLLVRWVTLEGASKGTELEVLNAALKLVPDAGRLLLARAHVLLFQLRYDAALADLRQVPLQGLAPRHAMIVMADRASLGDADAIEAAVPELAAAAPAMGDYVRGRIALAQGRWPDAQAAFEAAARRAEQEALIGALSRSWLFAATAAGAGQGWDGMERDAAEARRIGVQHQRDDLTADAEWLMGYAQLRRGDITASTTRWERAASLVTSNNDHDGLARLWLQRARLEPAWGLAQSPPPLTDAALPPGLSALVAARQSWLACDAEAAVKALTEAEGQDLGNSYFVDEVELLRQDLGLKRLGELRPPSLPYPWLARWITFWESSRSGGIRACAAS